MGNLRDLRRLFLGLYPIGLVGVLYDAMGRVKHVGITRERVHVCDLRAIDTQLLSVSVNGSTGSVHDWLQAHPSTTLDVLCAIPYGTFIFVTFAFAVFLYVKDYAVMQRFCWTFFALNLGGFITHHLYPAAPPWYFHAHGCVVDLSTRASEGPNLARVDALLGVHYFAAFYGRSNEVFGAMPSLHVGYPSLMVLFGWRLFGSPGRALSVLFLLSMCFAAVYLDHHWIVDVIAGVAYTGVVAAAVGLLATKRMSRVEVPLPAGADP